MAVITLEGISQEFGGLRALDSVYLTIEEHEIFGIIGPNGAGKTTLFNIITGIYVPTEGSLFFKDQRLNKLPAYEIARLGIGRTFQNIRLFDKLSVLDNVRVGCHGVTRSGFWSGILGLPSSRQEEGLILTRSQELLEMVGPVSYTHIRAHEPDSS